MRMLSVIIIPVVSIVIGYHLLLVLALTLAVRGSSLLLACRRFGWLLLFHEDADIIEQSVCSLHRRRHIIVQDRCR